jgi:hypothetical protein
LHEWVLRGDELWYTGVIGWPSTSQSHSSASTMPTRSDATKPVYRIRNWKAYNDALVRRGSLTLWVEPETLEAWRHRGPAQRGAQFQFSDMALECLLTGLRP